MWSLVTTAGRRSASIVNARLKLNLLSSASDANDRLLNYKRACFTPDSASCLIIRLINEINASLWANRGNRAVVQFRVVWQVLYVWFSFFFLLKSSKIETVVLSVVKIFNFISPRSVLLKMFSLFCSKQQTSLYVGKCSAHFLDNFFISFHL